MCVWLDDSEQVQAWLSWTAVWVQWMMGNVVYEWSVTEWKSKWWKSDLWWCVKQCSWPRFVTETMQNQRYSAIKKRNNATSASDSSPSRSLSSLHRWKAAPIFTWVLPLAGSYPSFCFVPPIFSSFLSIVDLLISVLCTQIERSLLSIQDTPLTADWLQVCFGTWSDTAVKSVFQKLLSAPLNISK